MVDQWARLRDPGLAGPRREILYNICRPSVCLPYLQKVVGHEELPEDPPIGAIRVGDWKYVWRTVGFDGWERALNQAPLDN